jgi:hypothetical protein
MLFAYLQTGACRDELFRPRWRDVDLSGRNMRLLWRKNAIGEWKEPWLPIGVDIESMLEKQLRVKGLLGFVFTWQSVDGRGKRMPYLYRQHWLKKLCGKTGVKQKTACAHDWVANTPQLSDVFFGGQDRGRHHPGSSGVVRKAFFSGISVSTPHGACNPILCGLSIVCR